MLHLLKVLKSHQRAPAVSGGPSVDIRASRTNLKDLRYFVFPDHQQLGYLRYLANLSLYMSATSSSSVIKGDVQFSKFVNFDEEFLLPVPVASICVENIAYPSHVNELLNKHSFTEFSDNKKNALIIASPSKALFDAFKQLKMKPLSWVPDRSINLDSVLDLRYIVKVLSLLLIAQTYEAFQDDEHVSALVSDGLVEESPFSGAAVSSSSSGIAKDIREGKVAENHGLEHEEEEEDDGAQEGEVQEVGGSIPTVLRKKRKMESGGARPSSSSSSNSSPPPRPQTKAPARRTWSANPSIMSRPWFTSVEDFAGKNGLFAPYDSELYHKDNFTALDVIQKYCFRSLGVSIASAVDNVERLRKSWSEISTTDAGGILTHIAVCADIALQAQAVCRPIFHQKGNYEGCFIIGVGFFVTVEGRYHRPIKGKDLMAKFVELPTHSASIAQIAALLDVSASKLTTIRRIQHFAFEAQLGDNKKTELQNLAKNLRFSQEYLQLNVPNFTTLIDALALRAIPEDLDFPMHPSVLLEKDYIIQCLSAFGSTAPVLHSERGSITYNFAKKKEVCPKQLFIARRSLQSASEDWARVLKTSRFANGPINAKSASAPHRVKAFKDDGASQIWSAVTSLLVPKKGVPTKLIDEDSDAYAEPEDETVEEPVNDAMNAW